MYIMYNQNVSLISLKICEQLNNLYHKGVMSRDLDEPVSILNAFYQKAEYILIS